MTTADKGGLVVIIDTENDFKKLSKKLIANYQGKKNSYKTLQTSTTLQHNKMANDTLVQIKNEKLLSKKTVEGMIVINPKTLKLHITSKIHKENFSKRNCIIY